MVKTKCSEDKGESWTVEIIWRLVSRYLCNVSQSLYVEVCAAVEKGDRPEISNNIFQKKVLKMNFTFKFM